MALYRFERLKLLVDRIAPSATELRRRNLVVRGEDFTHFHNHGDVVYREDGIFVKIDGHLYRRYIYMKDYRVDHWNDFPRFHLIACSRVNDIGRGWYLSGSSKTISVRERDNPEIIHENITLKLCGNCREEYLGDSTPETTVDFFNSLEQIEPEKIKESELRPDGYTWDWDIISMEFRKARNYRCENPKCGIQIDNQLHRQFIEVHHKNRRKEDNRRQNLIALCVLCHAFQDEVHRGNSQRIGRMNRKLKLFVDNYGESLQGNPFLQLYNSTNVR